MRKLARSLSASLALLLAGSTGLSHAKDGKNLWYLGGSLLFHSTQDTIRSNADLSGDPRPDDFTSRETTIEDTFSYGLTAGFGMTRRLSLQLDAAWFKGEVGPIEGWFQDRFPVSTNPANPTVLNSFRSRQSGISITPGEIEEIPVTLTGVLRFRTDRPLNPYLGAGAGVIFTKVTQSEELDALNSRLGRLRITDENDEFKNDLVPERYETLRAQGRVPYTYPLSIRGQNQFEWHLTAGMEYFMSDRVSMVADLRYSFAPQSIILELGGEDQLDIRVFSEGLFRPDGSLKIFNSGGMAPNPLVDPNDPSRGTVHCIVNTISDFDQDGHADDLCYFNDSSRKSDDPVGRLVVQGGRIALSGFAARLSLRVYF